MKQRHVDSPDLNGHSHLLDLQNFGDAVLAVEEVVLDDISPGNEQPEIAVRADSSIFTQAMAPFKPARVTEILCLVHIGDDMSFEEHASVQHLVEEFADVFALSVHEVKHIPGT